jgi:hypothetical protein
MLTLISSSIGGHIDIHVSSLVRRDQAGKKLRFLWIMLVKLDQLVMSFLDALIVGIMWISYSLKTSMDPAN